jgi:hypothetical protein
VCKGFRTASEFLDRFFLLLDLFLHLAHLFLHDLKITPQLLS